MNYFGFPHTTTKHFTMCQPFIDFENRRAIAVDEDSASITLTTVQDMGAVVAEALDYEGAWPVDGGMRGTQTTVAEVIELARRLRGEPIPYGHDRLASRSPERLQCRLYESGESELERLESRPAQNIVASRYFASDST